MSSLTNDIELTIVEKGFAALHPELHHYTTLSGLTGIVQSNTIWASYFADLNDTTEVKLLGRPLATALSEKFNNSLQIKQKESTIIRQAIQATGSIASIAEAAAKDLVEGLYKVTFEQGTSFSFAEPFISSFCSHASDGDYEKEHGLLSQWRGYGKDGGFCLVFDTAKLAELLGQEFDSHYWIHMNMAPAQYAVDSLSVKDAFPKLIDVCNYFFMEILENNREPAIVEDGFAPFVAGATLFKHQGFQEEREVRIVAIPGTERVKRQVQVEHPDFQPTLLKNIRSHNIKSGARRYLALFDSLGITLPIKRIIVGPSQHQKENCERARSLLGHIIPIFPSATPFIDTTC